MKKKKDTQLAFSVIPDGEQGAVLSTALDLSTLEAHLWEAANILRGPVDAADFKTYIFPLLFFKRISDDELDTLVMDADALAEILELQDPHKSQELELKIIARLRKHKDIPKFIELGRRLEELKERHEQGLLVNLAFIKQLLEIAKEVVEAEKEVETSEEQDKGKAALTELFNEVRNNNTSVMVERIVNDIDQIVRIVRFPGWQQTIAGDREVKQALRKTLLKYKLHQEQDLFDRAYQYIKQYY